MTTVSPREGDRLGPPSQPGTLSPVGRGPGSRAESQAGAGGSASQRLGWKRGPEPRVHGAPAKPSGLQQTDPEFAGFCSPNVRQQLR